MRTQLGDSHYKNKQPLLPHLQYILHVRIYTPNLNKQLPGQGWSEYRCIILINIVLMKAFKGKKHIGPNVLTNDVPTLEN